MVEEIQLIVSRSTASGAGLKFIVPNEESKFLITAKDFKGAGETFAVESKETEIKSSVLDKKNGIYEVVYSAPNVTQGEHFSLGVTLYGQHIDESPFSVRTPRLLLEFSTAGNQSKDWLDSAVRTMSDISQYLFLEDLLVPNFK